MLSGDVFAILPGIKRDFWDFETAVSLIEADRVCNENNMPDSDDLAGGIRTNKWGEPIEYHILKTHPPRRLQSLARVGQDTGVGQERTA